MENDRIQEIDITNRLSDKQFQAVTMLLSHSVPETAEKLNVTTRTIYRWLGEESFASEVQKTQSAIVTQVANRLSGLQTKVIDTLLEGMEDDNASVRIRAAKYLSDFFLRYAEIELLNRRLSDLEQMLSEK